MTGTNPAAARRRSWCCTAGARALLALAAVAATPVAAERLTITNTLADGYRDIPLHGACKGNPPVDGIAPGYWIERPHWRFNARTGKWVMWAHYEFGGYGNAQALVAVSDTECGTYKVVKTFRPLGKEVRDDFLFEDDDGTGYFLAASNKNGAANDTIAIFRLTPDWLDVDERAGVSWAFSGNFREAPIVMKKDGVYFMFTSQAAGWHPSAGAYATATSMMGDWSGLTYLQNVGGQTSEEVIVKGTNSTAYMLRLDHLGGNDKRDDGQMLLPVLLDAKTRTATMKWYSQYYLDTVTGTLTLPPSDSIATNRRALASGTVDNNTPYRANDRSYQTGWFASGGWPAWWMTDLGSVRHVGEVQISWPLTNGSEGYYKYRLEFSEDGTNWSTVDRRDNTFYAFTVDKVDVRARYLRVRLDDAVLWNNPHNWYTPGMWDVTVLP